MKSADHIGRLHELDALRGLAMCLVVFGHMQVGGNIPEHGAWYVAAKNFIYMFHMPFFMLLSGLAFGLSQSRPKQLRGGLKWLARQADRTLIPFVVMAIAILIAKEVASHFVLVPNYQGGLLQNIGGFFFFDTSPVRFLWFLPVLFVFYAVTYILHLRLSFFQIFLISVAIYMAGMFINFKTHWSSFLYFNQMVANYLYFCTGLLCAIQPRMVFSILKRALPVFVIAAGALLVFPALTQLSNIGLINRLIVSAVFICLLFGASAYFGPAAKAFGFIGRHTLIIYLLNVPVLAMTLIIWKAVIGYDGALFIIAVALACLIGLLLPIAIKVGILARSKIIIGYVS